MCVANFVGLSLENKLKRNEINIFRPSVIRPPNWKFRPSGEKIRWTENSIRIWTVSIALMQISKIRRAELNNSCWSYERFLRYYNYLANIWIDPSRFAETSPIIYTLRLCYFNHNSIRNGVASTASDQKFLGYLKLTF